MTVKADWPIRIRQYWEEDEGFVYKTWMDTLRSYPPFAGMSNFIYRKYQRQTISKIRDRATVLVAVDAEDDSARRGFICYGKEDGDFVLFFIYVCQTFRQGHVATRLLQAAGVDLGKQEVVCAAWTTGIGHQAQRWRLSRNPFLAWMVADAAHRIRPSKGSGAAWRPTDRGTSQQRL